LIVARQRARVVAGELGFGAVDQSRIATAVSELARNVLRYAEGSRGEVLIRATTARGAGIEIVVSDAGPGIADVELVLRPGYTSGHGFGMGLPGTKRLMDEMEIESAPGRGTIVTIRKWRR
jgi:serine/threonine-protein kinase RsbT